MVSIKEILKKKLTSKEREIMPRSFDAVGDIAIIEIPEKLEKKEKTIAEALLKNHKNLKVVVKKQGAHKGTFRLQKYKILAGERRKKTTHRENNLVLHLHIEEAYFSPRLSTDRLRIAEQVKKKEEVLVLFSGIGPYPLTIEKVAHPKSVTGIEMNPKAHDYALENAKKNKAKVIFINADVKKFIPHYKKKFDRILMPLPKDASDFLQITIPLLKKPAMLHFYDFLHEEEFAEAQKKIKDAAKALGRKVTSSRVIKCGQQSPRVYRVCVDAKIQ